MHEVFKSHYYSFKLKISRFNLICCRSDNKVGVSRNESVSCGNFDVARISTQSATTDQDSFDDIDDDDTLDGEMRPIGKCVALYPFDGIELHSAFIAIHTFAVALAQAHIDMDYERCYH